MLLEVTVSGSVGKQVTPKADGVFLKAVVLSPSGANATVKIRDQHGGASGDVVLFARAPSAHGSKTFNVHHKFTKGMHVTVVGTNAVAYLDLT